VKIKKTEKKSKIAIGVVAVVVVAVVD